MKNEKRKRLVVVGLAAVLALAGAWRAAVWAQETLAGMSAAGAAGATLGAAAGSGIISPGQATRSLRGQQQNDLIDEAGNAGGPTGGGAAVAGGAATGGQVAARVAPPLQWGKQNGDAMVRQFVNGGGSSRSRSTPTPKRSARRQSRYSKRVSAMTPAQRSKSVLSKYKKPPVGWLKWYLPEDRYKMTSKVWQYVTTPNDKYYYEPWASVMRKRNPARVIGFHTWQDALIAGYRPDPVTRPEPGQKLAYLASITRGPALSTYFEYLYAGQITPQTFDANYRYIRRVAALVGSKKRTRNLVAPTVEKILLAAVGQGTVPRYVGGTPPVTVKKGEEAAGAPDISGAPGDLTPGGGDGNRAEEYDQFKDRAGNLARKPGS